MSSYMTKLNPYIDLKRIVFLNLIMLYNILTRVLRKNMSVLPKISYLTIMIVPVIYNNELNSFNRFTVIRWASLFRYTRPIFSCF